MSWIEELATQLSPTVKIAPKWKHLWEQRERSLFRASSYYFFGFFGTAYILHYFFIDLPLKKEPLYLWAAYRGGLATVSIAGFLFTRFQFQLTKNYKIPMMLAGLAFSYMQAISMTWRKEVHFSYAIILPCIVAITLRMSVPKSILYLIVAFAIERSGWNAYPGQYPYILSAAIVGSILVSIFRSRMVTDVQVFISDQERVEADKRVIEVEQELSTQAYQVAHDIRSPLAALEMISSSIKELPEEKRLIIRNSVSRIRDIANDLLNRNRNTTQTNIGIPAAEEKKSPELLQSLIEPLITEKRLQFRSKLNIEIICQIDSNGYGLFATIQPTEFKRVLSNLINNSVEAFTNSGAVTITLKPEQKNILVEIKDNGKGIPETILAKLGGRGETHAKEGGSGLGFYHAKKSVENWGGTLTITSQVGKGTTVTITLPQVNTPGWFVPKLLIYPAHQIVVLDDDPSIHQIWKGRFNSAVSNDFSVHLHHFTTESEITHWSLQPGAKSPNIIYLVDYELIGQKKSGLDIIESLGISKKAILVTSRYEEEALRRRCEQHGIKMIPKGLAGFVHIEAVLETSTMPKNSVTTTYEKCDCILIDDDSLVRMTWGFAAKDKGKILKAFPHPNDFFEVITKIDPKTPLYIDSHLGEGLHGEEIAKKLFENYGFSNIYLATGYTAKDFDLSKMSYLKGVIGKDNPWN